MTTLSKLIDWVLKDEKRPMSAEEIWRVANARYYTGNVDLGKTPRNAIEDRIYNDISNNRNSRYGEVGASPLRFYLRSIMSNSEAQRLIEEQSARAQPLDKSGHAEKGLHPVMKRNAMYYSSRVAAHYVMAELFRRKCLVGSTEGNAPKVDLLGQTENGKHFSVEVRSKWTSLVPCWLVGEVEPEEDLYFVLVDVPRQVAESPKFYILTSKEAMKLRQQSIEEYKERKRAKGETDAEEQLKRYPAIGIFLKAIDNPNFAERWEKVLS